MEDVALGLVDNGLGLTGSEESSLFSAKVNNESFVVKPSNLIGSSQEAEYLKIISQELENWEIDYASFSELNLESDSYKETTETDLLRGVAANQLLSNKSTDPEIGGNETLESEQLNLELQQLTEIEVPFPIDYPIEAVEKVRDRSEEPRMETPKKIGPPIFRGYSPPVNRYKPTVNKQGQLVLEEGAELIFEKTLFENVGQQGQQNFTFYWQSNDKILKEIKGTDPNGGGVLVTGMERRYIPGITVDDSLGRSLLP